MCKSNKIPPIARKDIPTYIEQLESRLNNLETVLMARKAEMKAQKLKYEALLKAKEEEEKERMRLQKLERKSKAKAGNPIM